MSKLIPFLFFFLTFLLPLCEVMAVPPTSNPQYEVLGRGVVAVSKGSGRVFVSWRYLISDPKAIAFNVYRAVGAAAAVKLNATPIASVTSFEYAEANLTQPLTYTVKPVIGGVEQNVACVPFVLKASNPLYYFSIPMHQVAGDTNWNYEPNDASVGDLDGDGEYEIVVKRDNGGFDNASPGVSPGTSRLQAYKLDGTFMWEVDLGPNIRQGAHYTQFMVYDFDGDGKAEIAVRTSELTTFGNGVQIGDTDSDGITNYVNPSTGYILAGPEFLSIIEGTTGRELARTAFIGRGPSSEWTAEWGDSYGNRIDRFLAGVGWFDGVHPSILICRGYYKKTVLEAWRWDGTSLTKTWRFDANSSVNSSYRGQGNHNLSIGDVDADGKDEVVYGACAIDDNGTGLYNTGLGHGDAMHLSDMDPRRPGLEVWDCHESPGPAGSEFRDARTGALIFGTPNTGDIGRAMASDIDPNHVGYEMWTGSSGGLRSASGAVVSATLPSSTNFGLWWGGGLSRYMLDGTTLDRWTGSGSTRVMTFYNYGSAASINGTKANPCLSADIMGDWREEVVYKSGDNRNLLVFSTSLPTTYRFYTLMHDRQYRNNVATELVAYNQPPHPGFYLGTDLGRLALAENGEREMTTTAAQVTLDAGYDYDEILWHNSLGTSRTATLTSRNCGVRQKYVVEVTQHGHVFRDSLYITFFPLPVTISVSGNLLSASGTGIVSYQWYRDGNAISGAISSTYTPVVSGEFYVKGVVDTGCDYQSDSLPFFITQAQDGLQEESVVVRPNPSSGMFIVELGKWIDDVVVQVENMAGANVFNRKYSQANRFEISLNNCPSGLYLLYIKSGDKSIVKKLSVIK